MYLYIYDCPGGSSTLTTTGCTTLASTTQLVSKWNLTAAYSTHDIVTSVNATLLPGRQLRVRLLVGGAALWIPLVSPSSSSIVYSG